MNRTILFNGNIYERPGKFAEALLIEDGVIAAVGSNVDILARRDGCPVIDCQGQTVIPGFNDSHCHLTMVGLYRRQVPLLDAHSIDEVIRRGRAFRQDRPYLMREVISGRGWHRSTFTEGEIRNLNRHDLDQVSTEVPVIFSSACGHMLACNTKAIERAGITRDWQVEGGLVEQDADGATGIFHEKARQPILALIPPPTADTLEDAIADAMAEAASWGITSVQTNDLHTTADPDQVLQAYQALYASGRGIIRTHHQVSFPSLESFCVYARDVRQNPAFQGDWHSLGPLKLFKDGSLGARSAMVSQAYLDDPQNTGIEVLSRQEAEDWCRLAAELGIPVVTHAIGDRAMAMMLEVYERYFPDPDNPLRNGLIHCQITSHALLRRMAERNIVAYYQPIFLRTDISTMQGRIAPEVQRESYAFKTYQTMGGPVALGTDAPVESLDPFANLYCAIARKDKDGLPESGFFPEECLSVAEAIDGYTVGSAWAQGMEQRKGRLQAGHLADLVVLDRDPFNCPTETIRDIRPRLTLVGGTVGYSDGSLIEKERP